MYEPVGGLSPVCANHDVNVRGATGVESGVDGGQLHNAVGVGVPSTSKPALRGVERSLVVCAVPAGRIG